MVANCIGSDQDGTTLGTYEMGVARAALAAINFTDLARTLERELAEARKAVKAGNDARREAARLREALRALDDTGVLDLPRGIRAEGAVIAARALLAPSGR